MLDYVVPFNADILRMYANLLCSITRDFRVRAFRAKFALCDLIASLKKSMMKIPSFIIEKKNHGQKVLNAKME